MAQYDGSIRIDTQIETKNATSQMMRVVNSIQKAEGEISRLRAKLEELNNTKIPTQEYVEIQKQIKSAEEKLAALTERQERFLATGGKQTSSSYQKMNYDAEQLRNTIIYANSELEDLVDTGKAFTLGSDSDEYAKIAEKILQLNDSIDVNKKKFSELKEKQVPVTQEFGKLKTAAKNALSAVTKGLSGAGSIGLKAFSALKGAANKAFSAIQRGGNKSNGVLSSFAKRVKNLALTVLVFNLIRKAFSAMVSGVQTGFQKYTQYSIDFANSVQGLKNAMSTLGNQIAAAFAPIVQMVIPWLTQLISVISTAISYVAQFIAVLGGKSTFVRAKKVQDGYNDSLDKTASSAKKAYGALAKFDDLDVLQKQEDTTGGGNTAAGAGDLFEEVPISDDAKNLFDWLKEMWENSDFYELGKILGEKLKEALENIPWDGIKETARKIGKSIASLINGFVEVDGLGYDIGYTLAQAINTAFEFLNSFVHELHWDSIGRFIAESLNGLFETIDWPLIQDTFVTGAIGLANSINAFTDWFNWDNISNTLANGFNTLTKTITSFFETVDLSAVGRNIGDQITKTFENIDWAQAGSAFSTAAHGLLDLIIGALQEIDWAEIGTSIREFLVNIDWLGLLQDVGTIIAETLNGLLVGAAALLFGVDLEEIWENNRKKRDEESESVSKWYDDMEKNADDFAQNVKTTMSDPTTWEIPQLWQGFAEEHIVPLMESVREGFVNGWNGIKEWFSEFWTGFTEGLSTTWENIKLFFSETWTSIKETATEIWNTFKESLLETWESIKENASEKFTAIKEKMSEVWTSIKETISLKVSEIKLKIKELLDKFTEFKTNAGLAFDNVKEKVVGALDPVISKVKDFIDMIRDAIGALKEFFSAGAEKVGNFVGSIFGGGSAKSASVNPTSVSSYSVEVPALATGSVIRGGNPFLALLGDQPSGQTNVEAPLATIEQAVENAIGRSGIGTGSINADMTLDGQVFARVFVPYMLSEMKRQGLAVEVLGVT